MASTRVTETLKGVISPKILYILEQILNISTQDEGSTEDYSLHPKRMMLCNARWSNFLIFD
jgi:hypothetical protein